MNKKLLVAANAMLLTGTLFAQTPEAKEDKKPFLNITGSVDAYYKYDGGKTGSNTYTSFTGKHNQFALGMGSVKFEHKGDKVSAVADLGFGPRAKEFAYNDEGITQAIKQLYVSYNPTEALKFTLGTWATHIGYELVDPQLNRNYSMSYMFTYGPFTHTGLKAEYTAGKSGFMLGVSNPTDFRIVPTDKINRKFLLAQYSFAASDAFKLFLNYAGGKQVDTSKNNQFDMVITSKLSEQFSLGVNGTVGTVKKWMGNKYDDSKTWGGAALYLNYDPAAWFGLTLRNEYFSDKDHLKVPTYNVNPNTISTGVYEHTLSANFKKGGLTLIPEIRYDHTNKGDLFVDADGKQTKNNVSLLFAAVYSF